MMYFTIPGTKMSFPAGVPIGIAGLTPKGRAKLQAIGWTPPSGRAAEPEQVGPLAPAQKRRWNAIHEAGHAVVAASYGFKIDYVRVNRDGSGVCMVNSHDNPRQRLDLYMGGPVAEELLTLPGSGFHDDPYGENPKSDFAKTSAFLADIVEQSAENAMAFGQRFNPMEARDREFRESCARVRTFHGCNMNALTLIADLLFQKSERGASLTGADVDGFRILPASRCGADLWWLN